VEIPAKHLVLLLLAALLAGCVLAGPASASPAREQRSTGAAVKSSSKDGQGNRNRAKSRSLVAAGRAVHGTHRRLVRIPSRSSSDRRDVAVNDGVPVTSTATPAVANPEVLFRGDFDAGFSGWYVQSLSERATLFSSGALEGAGAARFEVRQGDVEPDTGSQRSEVSGPTFDEGQDLYIRDAIRIPASNTYSVPWQIIQQLHEEDWGGSPGMAVMLDNKRSLKLGAGDGSKTFWQGPSLQPDRWYDLVYRVNLSQSSSTGFVEVWLDGAQQSLANGQTRIYGQTIQAAQTYLKAGIYRSKSSTGTSVVEHDAIVVGTSLGAVMAG
jgi:Polysaccharide lyase